MGSTETRPRTEVENRDYETEPVNLLALENEIRRKKSPEAANWFSNELAKIFENRGRSGKPDQNAIENLINEAEKIPDLLELQERALNKLEEAEIVQKTENNNLIVDIAKLKQINSSNIRSLGQIYYHKFYGNQKLPATLFLIFKDRNVVSKEDYLAEKEETKPLFYSPKNESEAFDREQIRQSDFYIGLWEIVTNVSSDSNYPSTDNLNFAEVSLACKIYHPKYGNGYRDERGRLMVHHQGKYTKASNDSVLAGIPGLKKWARSQPREYVQQMFPALKEHHLLLPEDFETRSGPKSEKSLYEKKILDTNGNIMIDGIQYYISKKPEYKNAEIYKISNDMAVVVIDEKIHDYFYLSKPSDQKIKIHSKITPGEGKGYYRVSQEGLKMTGYGTETFREKGETESDDDHIKRLLAVENFELWRKISSIFGPAASHKLLKSLEFNQVQAGELFSLFDKIGDQDREIIYQSYKKAIQAIHEFGSYLKTENRNMANGKEMADKIVEEMLKNILNKLLGLKDNQEINAEEILKIIDETKKEVRLFGSVYKNIKIENKDISLEDFSKFKFQEIDSDNIPIDLQDKMKQMIIINRTDRPDIIPAALNDFEMATKNKRSKVFVLNYDEQMIGFFRVDYEGQIDAHLASLNIAPEIRGSLIGDEVLNKYIAQALGGRIGHAEADPRNRITQKYIGKYGFVGEKIEDYSDSEVPYIKLLINPHLNSELKFLYSSDQEIINSFRGNEYQVGNKAITLCYQDSEMPELLQKAKDILSSGDYVISAFRKINNENKIYIVFEFIGQGETREKIAA